jgi:hypothetical protein
MDSCAKCFLIFPLSYNDIMTSNKSPMLMLILLFGAFIAFFVSLRQLHTGSFFVDVAGAIIFAAPFIILAYIERRLNLRKSGQKDSASPLNFIKYIVVFIISLLWPTTSLALSTKHGVISWLYAKPNAKRDLSPEEKTKWKRLLIVGRLILLVIILFFLTPFIYPYLLELYYLLTN